jgi:hypothetical protein
MTDRPFQAQYGSGLVVAASSPATTQALTTGTKQARIVNIGANLGYYRIGKAGQPACSTADVPLPAGTGEVVTRAEGDGELGVFSASGTTFHIIIGEGE